MQISLESPDQPDVVQLIDDLDAYQKPLYPPESHHGIDIAALSAANVLFAVARDLEGKAVGCGAIVVGPEFGELKRMFVRPENRGQGIAAKVLGFLEHEAKAKGCMTFMLETGPSQPEAISLYARAGYERRGPFGGYGPDPFSVFMQKTPV
ncbi:putative acetyltransferase [Variovorax sp. OK605]|jgi:putative acetyltransferase|uniref:GNAT family N-acetyltransferase n=1 Tax=unclassified Variovorax TaxID=663243 RepID=UPI0008C7DC5A|nr:MULTISPECIES: GNAT family N-acetyltransferase [unclassified Variovorax]SEJ70553.1 putative acetyltransferase [Variovorax sp. OK202]SFC80501.1 putative acetyltransferase [Variovorax sp. OK212]SFO59377.1 putative acetyltransferase [Variovorax sp. OK605]